MASFHQSIRIPPDSTGKKVFNRVEVCLGYKNGVEDFRVNDTVEGGTSGTFGTVIKIEGTTNIGTIHLILSVDSQSDSFVDSEDLLVGGVKYAEANNTGEIYYLNANMLFGGNSTQNSAFVDNKGQLYTRNAAGVPDYDISGKQRVVQEITMSSYEFNGTKDTQTISDVVSGTSTATGNTTIPCEVLTCPAEAGQHIRRIGDIYNRYNVGSAQIAVYTLYLGDNGKENVVRKWGYYDSNNGFYFEVRGEQINLVVRSKTSGTITELRIPREEWNEDRLDGTGDANNLSGFDLDLTKTNIYYIEYRGTAGVNFGIYDGDLKLVIHKHQHTNNYNARMTAGASLPSTWEQFTVGIPPSTSEMYLLGIVVKGGAHLFEVPRTAIGFARESVPIPSGGPTGGALWTPVMSFRPGKNRKWIFPHRIYVYPSIPVFGRVMVSIGAALVGATWANTVSSVQIDTAAYYLAAGTIYGSSFGPANVTTQEMMVDVPMVLPYSTKLIRKANIDDDNYCLHITLEFRAMPNQPAGFLHVGVIWIEV
jgi:hypothetical protein